MVTEQRAIRRDQQRRAVQRVSGPLDQPHHGVQPVRGDDARSRSNSSPGMSTADLRYRANNARPSAVREPTVAPNVDPLWVATDEGLREHHQFRAARRRPGEQGLEAVERLRGVEQAGRGLHDRDTTGSAWCER